MTSIHSRIMRTLLLGVASATLLACRGTDGLTPQERQRIGRERATETAQLFEGYTHATAGADTLPYRLLKPLNYDPLKKSVSPC